MTVLAPSRRVTELNEALDAGARAAWELEPKLEALYLKMIRAQCAVAVRRLNELAPQNPDDHVPVTAAQHADWTKPDPDELGLQLREQMDDRWETGNPEPVRVSAMKRVMSGALQVIGVGFDVRNPAVAGVLAQLGRKITDISATTRTEIMRSIDTSWEKGYSIPHTADEIRKYARDVAPSRAQTIARTELIGAVNGGSHAVAKLSNAHSPGEPPLMKLWLTAQDERVRETHVEAGDEYSAGNGIPLDDPFSVGEDALQYPGDPTGTAGEVINCRCAISYEERGTPGGGVSDVSPDAAAIDGDPPPNPPPAAPATLDQGQGQPETIYNEWDVAADLVNKAYKPGRDLDVYDAADALRAYSNDAYKLMNSVLRGHNDALSHNDYQITHGQIQSLRAAFDLIGSTLHEDALTFRGMSVRAGADLNGTVITDPAFVSTSLKRSIAEGFVGESDPRPGREKVIMRVHAPAGTPYLPGEVHSERELILKPGTRLAVIREGTTRLNSYDGREVRIFDAVVLPEAA